MRGGAICQWFEVPSNQTAHPSMRGQDSETAESGSKG